MGKYQDIFTTYYPVFAENVPVSCIQVADSIGVLYQQFGSWEKHGWSKLQGLIFAGVNAYIFHLIVNGEYSLKSATEWLSQILSVEAYEARLEELARQAEQICKEAEEQKRRAEEERLRKEAEERKRQAELLEQKRKAEEERLRKEAEERKRQAELLEQKRRAEEERLRKEAEERKRQAELLEQQRRAEERIRKHYEKQKNRYDQLLKEMEVQEQIIAENKSWFGRKAKLRKEAKKRLADLQQLLQDEFPDGAPTI